MPGVTSRCTSSPFGNALANPDKTARSAHDNRRRPHLTSQDRDLITQHQNLQLLRRMLRTNRSSQPTTRQKIKHIKRSAMNARMPDPSRPFGHLPSRQATTSPPSLDTLHAIFDGAAVMIMPRS
ncbi:MAG: hypothetical protein ACRDOO_06800 [Actinomadura sp.]